MRRSSDDKPKVVFNPLTKSYERDLPSISRVKDSPSPELQKNVPSSDQLVNELLDEVSAEDDENRKMV